MSESVKDKKKQLREIIRQLNEGVPPQEVKERFRHIIEGTSAEDIARFEQELVEEGMPREHLQKLCDVHLAVFSEQVQQRELHLPSGHPLSILMEEHKAMLERADKLKVAVGLIQEACDVVYVGDALTELKTVVRDFVDAEKHYQREENVLFPMMERHGITEPPAVMWMEHDKIREVKRKLTSLVERWNNMAFQDFKTLLAPIAETMCEILPDHFFKENNILFPSALQVVMPAEWEDVRREFDDIGYCPFTPQNTLVKMQATTTEATETEAKREGVLQFETGVLRKEEAEAILDTIPLDISFVDANDSVRYFNKAEKRIFVRTKAVLGRKVQMCHPQKSIHIVTKIVEAFKTGTKDAAEFWITLEGKFVHIRFFAVRNKQGKYLGTIEVVQDITDIKKLEGQRRLLDWQN